MLTSEGLPPDRPLKGAVFDLDGTLVDSRLDFDLIRQEMDLPANVPVLESLDRLPEPRAAECRDILERHEREGAQQAALMPGVLQLLALLDKRGIHRAVFTRNSRRSTEYALKRCGIHFSTVFTRDHPPIKPHPEAIRSVCRQWGCGAAEVAMIGDFRHDLEAGRAAGAVSVLYTGGRNRERQPWMELADIVLASFWDADRLLFTHL